MRKIGDQRLAFSFPDFTENELKAIEKKAEDFFFGTAPSISPVAGLMLIRLRNSVGIYCSIRVRDVLRNSYKQVSLPEFVSNAGTSRIGSYPEMSIGEATQIVRKLCRKFDQMVGGIEAYEHRIRNVKQMHKILSATIKSKPEPKPESKKENCPQMSTDEARLKLALSLATPQERIVLLKNFIGI